MHYICDLKDLADPGSRGFSITIDDQTIDGFVVQRDGELFAYRNQCPHTGAPLDWVEHQFLNLDQSFIQCAVHAARFEISSGDCVDGPCVGDALSPLRVVRKEDRVYLDD